MSNSKELDELGARLVEDSLLNEEFSAQRGLINELFPYVYEASKRMSSRAISRWLGANGTKLSPATIARALRNPKQYWEEMYEDIQPAALIFARAHGEDPEAVLEDSEFFSRLKAQTPTIDGITPETHMELFHEYEDACATLEHEWFSFPSTCREACLSNVSTDTHEEEVHDSSKEEAK